jgi:hypothetical protein
MGCYLCEQRLLTGEMMVLYRDTRFWEQSVLYHADCWEEADLAAKLEGRKSVIEAAAVELPEIDCVTCGQSIEPGDLIYLVERGRGRGRVVRYHHARCFDPYRAGTRGW